MKQGLLFVVPFLLFSASCASQYGIVKARAFERAQVAGTIRADDQGRPQSSGISKAHLIYIETRDGQPLPEWETAWVEGQPFAIRPVEVKQEVHLGQTKEGKEVVVNARPHQQLWQLVLLPAPSAVPDSKIKKDIRQNPVVLTGSWKNKPFHYGIHEVQSLESIFGQ